jgi:hypothetical protein
MPKPPTNVSPKADSELLMTSLAEDASYLRPLLFAVFGVDRSGRPSLGWGMQLGADEAVFYQPGSSATWISTSAEQILGTFARLGPARLVWLDD